MTEEMFTKKEARKVYRQLEAIVDEVWEKTCDFNCRECPLLAKIRAGKGTQCTLGILRLCLIGEV